VSGLLQAPAAFTYEERDLVTYYTTDPSPRQGGSPASRRELDAKTD